MATFKIVLTYHLDGDESANEVKSYVEEALDGGAMYADVQSIEEIPYVEDE